MDLYERLSRMMMRRKYARVEDRADRSSSLLTKSKTVKVPRSSESRRNSKLERTSSTSMSDVSEGAPVPAPVVVRALAKPKRYTLRSSHNEAIDGAWFNNALRRSVAEGRINLSTVL